LGVYYIFTYRLIDPRGDLWSLCYKRKLTSITITITTRGRMWDSSNFNEQLIGIPFHFDQQDGSSFISLNLPASIEKYIH
jgi:hypothetical protein